MFSPGLTKQLEDEFETLCFRLNQKAKATSEIFAMVLLRFQPYAVISWPVC